MTLGVVSLTNRHCQDRIQKILDTKGKHNPFKDLVSDAVISSFAIFLICPDGVIGSHVGLRNLLCGFESRSGYCIMILYIQLGVE